MPDSWNMRTEYFTGKVGSAGVDPMALKIAQTAQLVEMNLSTIGSDVRTTRLGYKNQQKIKAFELMAHLAENLAIHPSVIVKAKEEFSRYRDLRESLQQFEGVVAACIILAFQEISMNTDLDAKNIISYSKSRLTATTANDPLPLPYVTADPSDKATATLSEIPIGLSVSLSLYPSLSLSFSLTYSLSLSHSHTHTLTPLYSLSLSFSLSLSLTRSLTLSLSL
jgi:hypothetical protein